MRLSRELSKKMATTLLGARTIGRTMLTEDDLIKYFMTIEAINNLPHMTSFFGGELLEEWEIPFFLTDLIEPKYLSIGGDEKYEVNLINREYKVTEPELSLFDFASIGGKICGAFRETPNLQAVSNFRANATISQWYQKQARMVNGELMVAKPGWFVPLELRNATILDDFFGMKAETAFMKWFIDKLQSVSTKKQTPKQTQDES